MYEKVPKSMREKTERLMNKALSEYPRGARHGYPGEKPGYMMTMKPK